MVNAWLARDSGKHHIRPEDKHDLAAHLAAHLWRTRASALPVAELENWLHLWLRDRPALAARYVRLHPEQLEEDLRTAAFLTRRDGEDFSLGAFRFAHTSLQEFFVADYLLNGAREDRPERWDLPVPSIETLDFLGQMLRLEPEATALTKMQSWARAPRLAVNGLLLAYAERARGRGWPVPSLRGLDLSGGRFEGRTFADLDLSGARFCGARLPNASFLRVTLANADFSGAHLARAIFDGANCASARFAGSDLTATTFHRCNLVGATAEHAAGSRTRICCALAAIGSP